MRRSVLAVLLFAASLLVLSCSSSPVKTYVGPDLPKDRVATLQAHFGVVIETLDGEKISRLRPLLLHPGVHTVEFSFREEMEGFTISYSVDNAFAVFTAEPGHTYSARWKDDTVTPDKWVGSIVDVATGKNISSNTIWAFTTAIEMNKGNARAYEARAYLYLNAGAYKLAIKDFDSAIGLSQKRPGTYYWRGVAHHNLHENTEALEDYTKAIELTPPHPSVAYARRYISRAALYLEMGNPRLAKVDCDKAIGLQPQFADLYLLRGVTEHRLGQYQEALMSIDKALQMQPKFPAAYTQRGLVYSGMGQYDKAIKDHERALEQNPVYFEGYKNLMWLLATCTDSKYRNGAKAVSYGDRVVATAYDKKGEDAAIFWHTWAAAHAEAGDFEKAESMEWTAVEMSKGKNKEDYQVLHEVYKKKQTYLEWQRSTGAR